MLPRPLVAACIFTLLAAPGVLAQKNTGTPDHFEVGRHTFFDFGPPFDFYEVLLVRSSGNGSTIERILVTPPGPACVSPATIETATGSVAESPSELLGRTDPCAIPEKELRRELKRCKKCLVFSGANITLRFPCGVKSRLIRSDILDRDMFSVTPNTPQRTSWTMQLLERLDTALGPGVMDKRVFNMAEAQAPPPSLDAQTREALESGAYDSLFPTANEKLSSLYRLAQVPLLVPSMKLASSTPLAPLEIGQGGYPPLARATRIQGTVAVVFTVDPEGRPDAPVVETGHPLLAPAAEDFVSHWRFGKDAAGQQIHAAIEFALNCPAAQN